MSYHDRWCTFFSPFPPSTTSRNRESLATVKGVAPPWVLGMLMLHPDPKHDNHIPRIPKADRDTDTDPIPAPVCTLSQRSLCFDRRENPVLFQHMYHAAFVCMS